MRRPFPPDREPAARSRRARAARLLAMVLLAAGGAAPAAGESRVVHVLIDPEGLPGLLESREDGSQVMNLPQFRLFDAEGRAIWSFTGLPRGFQRELERRLADPEPPLPEARTFRQEARHFLRRGGLPLNLTTLPLADLTVVEYWAGGCQVSKRLAREVDRFFARRPEASVTIFRVLVDSG